jgi:peptide/nickel transport system substrate-binding protein
MNRNWKISRRGFLGAATILGGGFVSDLSLRGFAQAATPRRGGKFIAAIADGQTTDSLDPALWDNHFTVMLGRGIIADNLLEVTPNNLLVPNIAESYETSDGGKTWLFQIKKDVTFHNGKVLIPADVVASYNHHLAKDSKSGAKSLLNAVDSISTDGATGVKFSLKFPYSDFPYTVADYHFAIFQAMSDGSIDWKSGIGTGPFVLDQYNPGVVLTGHKNRNYHGQVWFDEIDLRTVADAGARTNSLLSGSVHYMDRCDLKTLSKLQQVNGIAIDEVPGFAYAEAPMIVTAPPFDNVDVRQALKYCFDRQEVVDKIFYGHATVG